MDGGYKAPRVLSESINAINPNAIDVYNMEIGVYDFIKYKVILRMYEYIIIVRMYHRNLICFSRNAFDGDNLHTKLLYVKTS